MRLNVTFTAALGTCPTQVRNSEEPRGVMGPGGLDPSAALGLKSTFPWKATSRKVTSSVCLQDQFSEWGWAVGAPEAFLKPPVVSLSISEESVRPEGSFRGGTKEPEKWTSPAALRGRRLRCPQPWLTGTYMALPMARPFQECPAEPMAVL